MFWQQMCYIGNGLMINSVHIIFSKDVKPILWVALTHYIHPSKKT